MASQTIPPTTPATVYVRWSSEAQTGRDSLRRQLEAARRYAVEHRLVIVETIIDEAVSAFCGGSMTYVGKGAAECYLACSSARRRRGCGCRALFNFNEAERHFLDIALTFGQRERAVPAAEQTQDDLTRIRQDVAALSRQLSRLLASFGDDSTDEVVAAAKTVRDTLHLARLEESLLSDRLIVQSHGLGLEDLHSAIREFRVSNVLQSPSTFLVRARIAHAAKAAGFIVRFHEANRLAEVGCLGIPRQNDGAGGSPWRSYRHFSQTSDWD